MDLRSEKMDAILPQKIIHTPKNEVVLDMGQNCAGYVIMEFDGTGHSGAEIILRHSETLDTQGNFSMQNLSISPFNNPDCRQIIKYIAKGQSYEIYEPLFTFHGFRYIKIESSQISLSLENFKGWAIYSQLPITSQFECSNSLLNRFHQNVTWSQRSNFVEIPTDCPQREKMGWTGDIQIYSPTAGLNMQIGGFITKWLMDLASEQRPDGSIPPVIPEATYDDMPGFIRKGTAGWSDAAILCSMDFVPVKC